MRDLMNATDGPFVARNLQTGDAPVTTPITPEQPSAAVLATWGDELVTKVLGARTQVDAPRTSEARLRAFVDLDLTIAGARSALARTPAAAPARAGVEAALAVADAEVASEAAAAKAHQARAHTTETLHVAIARLGEEVDQVLITASHVSRPWTYNMNPEMETAIASCVGFMTRCLPVAQQCDANLTAALTTLLNQNRTMRPWYYALHLHDAFPNIHTMVKSLARHPPV
jgi:hypothetical protein